MVGLPRRNVVGPWLLDNVSSSTWYYAVRAYAFRPSRVVQWDPELVTTILPTIVYDESYCSASFEWQFSLWLSLVEQNGFWPSHYGNLTFKSTSSASPFEILLPFRALTHTHTNCTVLCTTKHSEHLELEKKNIMKLLFYFAALSQGITRFKVKFGLEVG